MIRYLQGLFTRNWGLKLVSIALALVLWLILVPADKILSEKTLTIPLETRNTPDGMEIVEKATPTIDVTVRAPSRIAKEISPSTLTARLNLERATVYQQEYPLNKSMISLPPGADVTVIRPNKALIKLEWTREAILDVHPSVRGKVFPGARISRIDVEPKAVAVRGPESKVRPRDAVTTAPIDVTGLARTAQFDVDIILPKPELRLVSTRTTVRVTITIEPEKGTSRAANPRGK
jgi:YbbR domain-containing protein